MESHVTRDFRECLRALPAHARQSAKASYQLFRADPFASSLRFKEVANGGSVWSARISLSYRALGVRTTNEIVWFWIGDHEQYDKLLRQFSRA